MIEDDVCVLYMEVLLHKQINVLHFTLGFGLHFGKASPCKPISNEGVRISETIYVGELHLRPAFDY